MTSAETRGTVTAYYKIRELLDQPLPAATRDTFNAYLQQVAEDCRSTTDNSAPARWARTVVGPILSAAVGAAVNMQAINKISALRIFGLHGNRALSNEEAWRIMRPYIHEPALHPEALAQIQRYSDLRLRLSNTPSTPIDVLAELTRPRSGVFPSQVSYWIAEYFTEHRDADTFYGEVYRSTLRGISEVNSSHETANIAIPHSGKMTREDWGALIHGSNPQARVLLRAGYAVARQFIAECWDRWNIRQPASFSTTH